MKKSRIWEIDALRGFCMVLVILAHLYFDAQSQFGFTLNSRFVEYLFRYGGLVFVVISGVSATLGTRSLVRGMVVFGCGMGITAASYVMIALGILPPEMKIWFGVLHLLGVCMMLYPLLKKLPTWALLAAGTVIVVLGYWFMTFRLPRVPGFDWRDCLFPLGLMGADFSAGDFFPLCPHLGWFMVGICMGRTVYRERRTRFPEVNAEVWPLRALRFLGRHSLAVYLVHQPIVYGILQLFAGF